MAIHAEKKIRLIFWLLVIAWLLVLTLTAIAYGLYAFQSINYPSSVCLVEEVRINNTSGSWMGTGEAPAGNYYADIELFNPGKNITVWIDDLCTAGNYKTTWACVQGSYEERSFIHCHASTTNIKLSVFNLYIMLYLVFPIFAIFTVSLIVFVILGRYKGWFTVRASEYIDLE